MVLCVADDSGGERIDSYLARQVPGRSRSQLKRLIQEGNVLVNQHSIKPGYEIRVGDLITLLLDVGKEPEGVVPQRMSLEILYEDDDILVVNKAPGVVVHPGAGHRENTLVHGLLAHCPRLASQGAPLRPGIVHRLDKGTSGAMVVAKGDKAYLGLIDQFKSHQVLKEYVALVYGSFGDPNGEIRACLDRHPGDRKKMAVVTRKGLAAVSKWTVQDDWGEVSLVRILIETGRTHQIRVHMSYLHHPVVGDATYGGGPRRAQAVQSRWLREILLQTNRPMLHARCLGFRHPSSNTPLLFTAPLAEDFSQLLRLISSSDRV